MNNSGTDKPEDVAAAIVSEKVGVASRQDEYDFLEFAWGPAGMSIHENIDRAPLPFWRKREAAR